VSSYLPAYRGGRTEAVFALTAAGRAALAAGGRGLGARQLATLRALAAGAVTGADLLAAEASADAAQRLAIRGLVTAGRRGSRRIPLELGLTDDDGARTASLTGAQADALAWITGAIGSGHGALLHGVTASGKTEVYTAGDGGGARPRAGRDRPGARDRPHRADRRAVRRPIRRSGRPASQRIVRG